ncbi:MAG: N-acetylneuraminate synthase [Pseudomonadota bacterium]|jgi:N-acetylneuraminate synthase
MKNHTYVIAEAGVNHNGSLTLAKQLVDAAISAGADAVKFQTFRAENLVTARAHKAEYQQQTTGDNSSQLEMLKTLELSEVAHHELHRYCQQQAIEFLSTPFDLLSLEFLVNQLNISRLKIASGEINNAPLLFSMAKTGKPVILSTGMSTLGDIEIALSILAFGYLYPEVLPSLEQCQQAYSTPEGQQILRERVTLLHCTTEYPAPFDSINLQVLETLRHSFGLAVGYSDHTVGITVPIAAVAKEACVIEKHLTIDKNLAGPDHAASLEPKEFKQMVTAIRQVELALGNAVKIPSACEWKNREVARKSLVAAQQIKKGEVFTPENLTVKRPASGISPLYYWECLGESADHDYQADELI